MTGAYVIPALIVGLLLCCGLVLYRISQGPTAPDRMVAIDILGTLVVGFVALIMVVTGKVYLLDIALAWALISFVGTLALAKFLVGQQLND